MIQRKSVCKLSLVSGVPLAALRCGTASSVIGSGKTVHVLHKDAACNALLYHREEVPLDDSSCSLPTLSIVIDFIVVMVSRLAFRAVRCAIFFQCGIRWARGAILRSLHDGTPLLTARAGAAAIAAGCQLSDVPKKRKFLKTVLWVRLHEKRRLFWPSESGADFVLTLEALYSGSRCVFPASPHKSSRYQ